MRTIRPGRVEDDVGRPAGRSDGSAPSVCSAPTRVQLEIRARRGADMAARASQPRTRVGQKASYLFRGAICCATCGRKMEGARRKHAVFYRCAARTLIPGSSAALCHPPTVHVREDQLSGGVNGWIAGLFSLTILMRLLQSNGVD
ncbi:recombinase zinc beta ribbon domain-containing protein [Kribbella sp. NPDC051952]|uniref:recombinase zinc beta ribbon domain-containing protein n=1 Tax=Kribbella sp. NPDC051952 TaxID=3154851 RepID=UPI00342B5175